MDNLVKYAALAALSKRFKTTDIADTNKPPALERYAGLVTNRFADGGVPTQRNLSPLGLYSQGAETAANLPQAKGSPQQMVGMLQRQGVKPEELFSTNVADESATNAKRSQIETEFMPKIKTSQQAMQGLQEGTPEFKAAERQHKNLSSTMRSEMDRALVLNKDWAARPSVTREELSQHFNEKMPQVEETVLGGKGKPEMDDAAKQEWIDSNAKSSAVDTGDIETSRDWHDASDEVRDWHREIATKDFNEQMAMNPDFANQFQTIGEGGKTKFQQYALPGGENYREVLLKMPETAGASKEVMDDLAAAKLRSQEASKAYNDVLEAELEGKSNLPAEQVEALYREDNIARARLKNFEQIAKQSGFKSQHWDNPNVLAHIRMADRTGENGEKILHVEELQSDWAQKGRKEGFQEQKDKMFNDLIEKRDALPEGEERAAIQNKINEMAEGDVGVPSAPYVTNTQGWTDLALKRVLKEAAEGGYDKVVWTPGAEQAARYDLSKQVGKVYYDPELQGGTLAAEGLNSGQTVLDKSGIKPEKVADYIGKEAAEKLLSQPRNEVGHHVLEGDGLKVGGEGMKGYYDNIVPTQLQKLIKKHDPQAKIEMHEIPDTNIVGHGITITPKMRESILQGMPHMAKGGNVMADKHDDDIWRALATHAHTYHSSEDPHFRKHYAGLVGKHYGGGGATDMAQPSGKARPAFAIPPAQDLMSDTPTDMPKSDTLNPNTMSLATAFDNAIDHHLSLSRGDRIANSKEAIKRLAPHVGMRKDNTLVPLLGKNEKLLKTETGYKGEDPVKVEDGRGIEAAGLALAPSFQMGKFNTCPNSASCKDECLGKTSGNYFKVGGGKDLSAFEGPRLNSLNKTLGMINEPEAFAVRLHDEIAAKRQEAANNGNLLGVRLNTLSDINPRVHQSIIKAFPDVVFYDYTKMAHQPVASNHHYTYSSTGVTQDDVNNPNTNWPRMRRMLEGGQNVAMAFTDKEHLPKTVHDQETGKVYKVVNGDMHDFRPLDRVPEGETGVIIGLKNKKGFGAVNDAHKDSKGFFVKYNPGRQLNAKGTYVRHPSEGLGPSGKPKLGPTKVTNTQVSIKPQTKITEKGQGYE